MTWVLRLEDSILGWIENATSLRIGDQPLAWDALARCIIGALRSFVRRPLAAGMAVLGQGNHELGVGSCDRAQRAFRCFTLAPSRLLLQAVGWLIMQGADLARHVDSEHNTTLEYCRR